MVEQGTIQVSYIPTRDMVADTLTKPLPKDRYWRFMRLLGLVSHKNKTLEVMELMIHQCKQCGLVFSSGNKLLGRKNHTQCRFAERCVDLHLGGQRGFDCIIWFLFLKNLAKRAVAYRGKGHVQEEG